MYTTETAAFNKPYKTAVAIDCRHIGDDNDYSCFLSGCVKSLIKAGDIENAIKLANTDPMLIVAFTNKDDLFKRYMKS